MARPLCFAGAVIASLVFLAPLGACDQSGAPSPTPVCSFALTPQEQSFTSEGGAGQVVIATDAGCAWSIGAIEPWITLQSASSGTGPSTVKFTVSSNAAESLRETMMMVATVPFRIRQDGKASCTFGISPETQSFPATGGNGQVAVTAGAACLWAATSNDAWITLATGASGRGTGTVTYSVAPNAATTGRSGTATIAGRTLTITQSGSSGPPPECTYSASPVSFTPCMPGGSVVTKITTQAMCPWTSASNASWLHGSTGGGSGSATITISYTDNYDAPREGIVMLRWPTATAGQNVHVAQAGCLYGVSKTALTFTSAAGSGTFDVLQESQPNECGGALQDQCVWTARASAPWVTIVTTMPRRGDNPVAFNVAANTGSARSATISVRDKVVTVSQSAAP
jgi:hypothetical protein